ARLLHLDHSLRRRPGPAVRHVAAGGLRRLAIVLLGLLRRLLGLLGRILRPRRSDHSRDEHEPEGHPKHVRDHTRYAAAMDLEILEALALSDDRASALAQLLPGSEDHDYHRCLHAQHAGDLAAADEILRAWPERHGHGERYERLRMRQQLYRLGDDP